MIKIANFPFKDLLKTLSDGSRAVKVQQNGSIVELITLADAIEIRDGNQKDYDLISDGGLTKEKILQIKELTISVYSTHNATSDVFRIRGYSEALGGFHDALAYYDESTILDGNTVLEITSYEKSGTGVGGGIKEANTLKSIISNIQIRLRFSSVPDSGAITIIAKVRY